ncbi:hypothetical protein AB0F61_27290, partial [Micromonospora sp. NPDC023888]
REEVAQLAFISTEYYTRLEQGTGITLSGVSGCQAGDDQHRGQRDASEDQHPQVADGPSRRARPALPPGTAGGAGQGGALGSGDLLAGPAGGPS